MGNRIRVYNEKKDCCGCTACEHICPKHAIQMKQDEEGFLYPSINKELCVDCNLCEKICQFNEDYDKSKLISSQLVYAVKHKDIKERLTSQSGGMFISLADYILSKNGSVYGVGYDEKFRVVYKRVTERVELKELKGSKYVQSALDDILPKIKNDLMDNKYVLFTGTPCFVAGVKSYLGNMANSEKLYLCDIVCHGTPSPLMWENYLSFIKDKYTSDISKIDFRDKSYGWHGQKESFYFDKKKITLSYWADLFQASIMLRPSCKNCHFCNFNRPSDITIGDFWGIEKSMPELDDNKGISLVIINTNRGKELFKEVSGKLDYRESCKENCVQPNLLAPSYIHPNRKKFWQEYNNNDFKYILKRYTEYGYKNKIIRSTKRIIKKVIGRK